MKPEEVDKIQARIDELTEQLEKLLQEDLPATARALLIDTDEATVGCVRATVTTIDNTQKELGLLTYQLLRAGYPVGGGETIRMASMGEEDYAIEEGRIVTNVPNIEVASTPAPAVPRGTSCGGCKRTAGVTICPHCNRGYCPEHHDPALHPCTGDHYE
jgi:hypothetical protein